MLGRSFLPALGFCAVVLGGMDSAAAEEVRVFAAGSLRLAMEDIARAYAERGGAGVTFTFGPSGKLRQMIEAGDVPAVFASASIGHTDALAKSGRLTASRPFTRNVLCLMAKPSLALDESRLVDLILDPAVRLGTSTPKADPAGDYTWELFRKVDMLRPGAYAALNAKALQLTGKEVNKGEQELPYPAVFRENRADVFISYCTNAVATAQAVPGLTWARFPEEVNVSGSYGIGAVSGAGPQAEAFVAFVMGPEGQAVLGRYGFSR